MDQLQDPNKPQPFAIKNDWIVAITDGDDNASINYQMTLEKLIERFGKTVDTGLIVMGIGVGSETKKKLETLAASAVKFGQYIGPDGSTDGIKAAFAKVGEIIQGRGRFNG